jgi:hypothetical protein
MGARWRRLLRALLIRLTAWGLRRGYTADQMRAKLARSYGHRPAEWREDVLTEALAANRDRLLARINA